MLKNRLLVVLSVLCLAVVAKADENQLDAELKAKDAKKIESFSQVEGDTEKVYKVTAEQAKLLPSGDASKLTKAQLEKLEGVIKEITKEKPIREVAVNKTKDEATSACSWYYPSGYYYNGGYYGGGAYYGGYYGGYYYGAGYNYYPNYCYGNRYYYGGGFYYNNGYYGSAWGYRGYYRSSYWGGCYWG